MKCVLFRSGWLAFFLIAACLLAMAGRVFAEAPVLSPAQYDRALAAVGQSLQAQIDLQNGISAHAADPQDTLQPILHCQVRDPAGRWLVTVDNTPLQDSISSVDEASDADDRVAALQAILAQVGLLRSGLSKNATASAPPDAQASVREVLSTNEFSSLPIPPPTRLDKWLDAFSRWLSRLFSGAHASSPSGPHIDPDLPMFILITIALVAAGIIIAFLIKAISRHLAGRSTSSLAPQSSLAMNAQEASLVATRDFERLMALAHRHAQDGDYRSAVRLAYLATLVLLDSEGVVRLNRSKTNWEYLRMVRSAGQEGIYTALLPFTRSFDRIWYGQNPAGAAESDEAIQRHEDVRKLLAAGPRPGAAQPART
ncbi:MAG TPA: DUF4129 domain-containing protein, partial [Capsulimonadaceae bacterium]|nr:DUF4129 domain-containing protein [Capsulimonadaceae bacterium]